MTTKKKEEAKVVSQEQLADGIFSMWIQTEAAGSARPGQFISMYTNDGSKLLPRPISICEIDKEGGKLRVVYRVTGEKTGTEEFSQMKAGDTIPVIGPLGNGFPFEKAEGKKVFLMGGGIGVPPILELAYNKKLPSLPMGSGVSYMFFNPKLKNFVPRAHVGWGAMVLDAYFEE